MEENKIPYEKAKRYADRLLELLKPHCVKCQIAGSIRRKKKLIGDIEIIAIPKPYQVGLFSSGIATVIDQWEIVKGKLPCKYTQRILPGGEGIKLDLFLVEEGNWGLQLAIRTGSAEYSHKILAGGWVRAGYKSKEAYLYKNGHKFAIPTEEDLYRRIGIPWIPPAQREV